MNLLLVLRESLVLMRKQPKVFIPKLVTTVLYSFYALWAASLFMRVYPLAASPSGEISGLLAEFGLMFLFIVFLYFVDLVSYAMYPSIVSDYYQKKPVKLFKSLLSALQIWKTIILLGVLLMVFFLVIVSIVGVIQVISLVYSTPLLLAVTIPFIILSILFSSVLVFFVVPLAVIEKKSLLSSFSESISLGLKHKKELLNVNVIFMVLAFATLFIGMLSGFTGLAGLMAMAAFIIVRLIQAVVYTYVCVVNPYLYLHVREST